MARFLALRLLAAIPVMAVVAVIVFLLLRLSGKPGALLAGDSATPEQIAQINASLGLDRPLHEQYLRFHRYAPRDCKRAEVREEIAAKGGQPWQLVAKAEHAEPR